MIETFRLCRAIVGTFCFAFALVAEGGYRESVVFNILEKLRTDEFEAQNARTSALHQSFLNTTVNQDRKFVSLGLGYHYIERNPRLAVQYLSTAEQASRDDKTLQPIVRYYLGLAKLKGGSFAEAAKIGSSLLEEDLPESWRKLAYSLAIEASYEAGDHGRLVSLFEDYTKKFSFSRRQETLARFAILALENQGASDKALKLTEELARGYPATAEARWAFGRLLDLSCDGGKSRRPRYVFSRRLLLHLARNVILGTGLDSFLIGAAERPMRLDDGSVRVLSPFEKAEFFYRAQLFAESLKTTGEIYEVEKAKPSSSLVPTLLLDLGRIHLKLYEPMAATTFFSKFIFDYPKHPSTARALELMGDALRYVGQPLAAAENYAAAIAMKDSNLLRWLHFWMVYRGRDYKGALALLERPGYVQTREGDDRITLTYWHARILEQLGKKAEADAKYLAILTEHGDSFYANLAALRRPELVQRHPVVVQNPEQPTGPVGGLALAARLLGGETVEDTGEPVPRADLKLIDDLFRVGMSEVATTQLSALNWGQFNQEESFASVSRLAHMLHDYNPTRRIRYFGFSALRSIPDSWWDLLSHQARYRDQWKVYFPFAYEKYVRAVAERVKISPYLVLSVMRAESFYNKEARSGVGAQGLMQIMPYTAMKIASLLGDQEFDVLDLGRPDVNVGYGTYYLDKLVRYYGGNPFLAVAAYNGGPVAVNQWLDSCKDCNADEFVEAIAYRETRRYVREVMKNFSHYSRLYSGQPPFTTLPKMPTDFPDGEEIF